MTQDQKMAERFIGALAQLEEGREVEPLIALYGDDADVGNINVPEQFHGQDGARRSGPNIVAPSIQ